MMEKIPKNIALTVDCEDWFHGLKSVSGQSTLCDDTQLLLDAFSSIDVRATFFVLADAAYCYPHLIRKIAEAGHEIACHGGTHDFLSETGPERFRSELRDGKTFLENCTGHPVKGFRAPFFSMTGKTCWALDILAEFGFEYDSSVYPGYNDRYGWAGVPGHPFRFMPSGLLEFPVPLTGSCFPVAFSGGAYLRILPFRFIRHQFKRYQNASVKGMIYIHPWEFSGNPPRIWKNNVRAGLTRYPGLKGMRNRLTEILKEYSGNMAPMMDIVRCMDNVQDYWIRDGTENRVV